MTTKITGQSSAAMFHAQKNNVEILYPSPRYIIDIFRLNLRPQNGASSRALAMSARDVIGALKL